MNQRITKSAYLLRREFWEHIGAVLWTPIILAGVAVFFMTASYILHSYDLSFFSDDGQEIRQLNQGEERVIDFSSGTITVSDKLFPAPESSVASKSGFIRAALFATFAGFQFVAFVVSIFYLQSCLFADRKDRSILFWKSLPVRESDSTLAKFIFALLVIPMVAFAVSIVMQLVTALALSVSASVAGDSSFAEIFLNVDFFNLIFVSFTFLLYCALKILPLYAWLMFASAWAKRSPFLVAVVPPLTIMGLEALIFGSSHFITLVANSVFVTDVNTQDLEFVGAGSTALRDGISIIGKAFMSINPVYAIGSAGVTVAFLSAAIWLRNNRYEI